jgi:hypothetical protein
MSVPWLPVTGTRACAVAAEASTIVPAPWARVPRMVFKNYRRWEFVMVVVLLPGGR